MRDAQPGTVYLRDYQPPAYLINRTELHFQLYEDYALVTSRLYMLRTGEVPGSSLQLHGQQLELLSVAVDGLDLRRANTAAMRISCLLKRYLSSLC